MKIKINKQEYHIGTVNYNNYPIIKKVRDIFDDEYPILMNKVIVATIKENYEEIKPLSEKDTITFLVKKIKQKLSSIKYNELRLSSDHCCLYEEKMVVSLNKCIKSMDKINRIFPTLKDEYDICFILLCQNTLRIIKGIIAMLSIGDDAHGLSLLRSLLESIGRIVYLDLYDVKKDFVKFNTYNGELQYAKMCNDYSILSGDFLKLLEENNLKPSSQKTEMFLLYGWMNGEKKIRSGKQLIEFAFQKEENVLRWYHLASEFVHEDYIMLYIDWLSTREYLVLVVFGFVDFVNEEIDAILQKRK